MRICCLTCLLYFITLCYGKDESNKNKMADTIIQKLYNISIHTFANRSGQDRERAWKIFENKLKTISSKRYGPDTDKYIALIMRGIKSMTPNTTMQPQKLDKPVVLRISNAIDKNKVQKLYAIEDKSEGNKKHVVRNIVSKLDTIAKNIYNKTVDRKHIIENIKHKITDLIVKKSSILQDPSEVKELGQRLEKYIESLVDSLSQNSSQVEEPDKELIFDPSVLRHSDHLLITTPPSVNEDFKGVTSTVNCDVLTEKVCSALKYANQLICPLDGKKISVDRLCDGINDCVDRYDERNCIQQAIDKIRDARRLITNVDETVIRHCGSTHLDNSLLSKQSDILGSVLQSELNFLRRHSINKSDDIYRSEEIIKRTVNEVALVLSSLSSGLEGSICPRYYGQDEEDLFFDHKNILSIPGGDKNDAFEDFKSHSISARSAPNKCTCDKGFCTDINCSHMCRLICWQKHSLGNWGCQAIDGGTTVTLGVLCDGKSDCYDQTDEEDCSVGDLSRFQATTIYDSILTELSQKSQASDMQHVRNNLLSLRATVSYLQKVTTQPKTQPEHVRTVRDLCFSALVATYNKVLSKGNIQTLDEIHHYLLSLNQKLIAALKRSHTGNDKIVTLEGCYCIKNRCVMARCSKKCERACSVEPQFIKYSCDGSPNSSIFVPSNAICNGKDNCPKGEDEIDCRKEMCRAHHLVVLRHDLNKVGDKNKGTALGAVLDIWKTKVQTTLMVAESNGRPTLPMVREVVDSITRDLVATYASLQNNKTESNAFRIFFDLSQKVLRVLKTCQ